MSALVAFGVPQPEIGKFLGITDDTLCKHYRREIDTASTDRNAKVAGFLFHAASGSAIADGAGYADCIRAAIFWAKTRMQWRIEEVPQDTRQPINIQIIDPRVRGDD